jgi:phosphate transport system permease protein
MSRGSRQSLRNAIFSPVGLIPLGILGVIVLVLVVASGLRNFGASFWSLNYNFIPNDPAGSSWGIGVFLIGTGITAGLALVLASALSLALAISITVYLPPIPSRLLTILTNLVAGIPSVVVGIWGFVILAPYFGLTLEPTLRNAIGWVPGFGGPLSDIGPWGLLLAVFILTIMIVPLTTALMRESLRSVPRDMVEAGLALGATRWEVVRRVRLRYARRGLWSAVLLGFGRAIGESVAVAMVIGAVPRFPSSLYAPSTSVASFIFYQLDSAFFYPDLLKLLVEYALVLLALAVVINLFAQRLTQVELATATTVGLQKE